MMFVSLLIIFAIYTSFKIFLDVKEMFFIKNELEKGDFDFKLMDFKTLKESALYSVYKHVISIIESMISLSIVVLWLSGGLFFLNHYFNDNSYISQLEALGIFFLINYFLRLPLDIYQKIIDKRFGFNNSSWKLYFIDQLKTILLVAIFGGVVMFGLLYFINNFENWWLIAFIFIFVVVILINLLLPYFMMMFNKFEPLSEGELKTKIEEVLKRAGFESDGLFSMNASKRDSRLNAFFSGFGKSKRVVLYDTLIEKLSPKEIVAVLGHELGHFQHKDIFKNIAIVGVMLFIIFYVFGHIPNKLFEEMLIQKTPLNILIITILFMEVLFFIMQPFMNLVSRHNEFEADKKGAELGSAEDLKNALIKLVNENKSFPKQSELYSIFYNSHPPVLERIRELEKI